MTSTASRKYIFVAGGPKLGKVLEDKEVSDDTINLIDHLEGHHLVNHVGVQHLDAYPLR